MLHAQIRRRDKSGDHDESCDADRARPHRSAGMRPAPPEPAYDDDDAEHQQQICELEAQVEAERHLPRGDEPTGALDAVSASSLDQLMQSLHDILGLSILIITHDPNTLVTVCDRIAMIVDKKVESGTLEEMLKSTNPKIREYFSTTRFKAALSERH